MWCFIVYASHPSIQWPSLVVLIGRSTRRPPAYQTFSARVLHSGHMSSFLASQQAEKLRVQRERDEGGLAMAEGFRPPWCIRKADEMSMGFVGHGTSIPGTCSLVLKSGSRGNFSDAPAKQR
ncbi:unnamed protein product [Prorocentrum cordatum]|uniref:Uncharacterized protein n=1 Tax=Prorocentrum cordatum TaxID=2364126 RepID=A0ABN9Y4W8_9DINO|nr:unnamed protein product [Polarella glacialis]